MRVVCSLTTIPKRIDCDRFQQVLQSIKNQTYPLDEIYLTIPKYYARGKKPYPDIPECILKYCQVVNIDIDYGPITKIVGGLIKETDPETIIITFDDDSIYPPTIVEELLIGYKNYPNSAIGTAGIIWGKFPSWIALRTYHNTWSSESVKNWFEIPVNSRVDLVLGVSGVLYIRKFFPTFDKVKTQLLELALSDPIIFRNDDVLLSCYLNSKNIQRIVVAGSNINVNPSSKDALSSNPLAPLQVLLSYNICRKWELVKTEETIPFMHSFTGILFIILIIVIIIIVIIIVICKSINK